MGEDGVSPLNSMLSEEGIPPEAVTVVIWYFAPKLASSFTSWWKKRYNTEGPSTKNVVKAISALLALGIGFGTGAYALDQRGVINCVCAAILTYIRTTGDYARDIQIRTKANEVTINQESVQGTIREIPPGEWDPKS